MLAENSDSDGMNLDFIAESERVKGLKAGNVRKLQKLKGYRALAMPALPKLDESQSRGMAYKQSVYWSQNLETVMNNHRPRLKVLAGGNFCQQVKVFLPANSKKQIRYVKKGQKLFVKLVGGATSYEVLGCYENKSGAIDYDRIVCVWAWVAADMMAEVIEKVENFAGVIIADLQEETVLIEINGSPHMVEIVNNRLCRTPLSEWQSRRRDDLAA
jgi:hypothetical protein